MSIEEPKPSLEYGRTPRKNRWKLWLMLFVLAMASGTTYWKWPIIRYRVERARQYHGVLNATRPKSQLILSAPEDAGLTSTAEILGAFDARTRPWGMAPGNAIHQLALLESGRTAGPGDSAVIFVGALVTPAGHRRLMTISVNLGVRNDASNAIVSFDVQLYDVGSYWNPKFAIVQVNADTMAQPLPGTIYPGFQWIRFESTWFRPGVAYAIEAGTVGATDSAAVRVPFSFDGHADAMLFTLGDGDTVTLRLESGRALPLKSE